MSQLEIEDNGDLKITNNSFTIIKGTSEIRQKNIQNLRTFLGEWFLDLTIGVPYHQTIFNKASSPIDKEVVIKDEILNVKGNLRLEDFSPLDFNTINRQLNVKYKVITTEGAISIGTSIP
jgi:ABC-type arginine transport system ATPase subunit